MSSALASWYHSNSRLDPAGTTRDEGALLAPFTLQLTATPHGSVYLYTYMCISTAWDVPVVVMSLTGLLLCAG